MKINFHNFNPLERKKGSSSTQKKPKKFQNKILSLHSAPKVEKSAIKFLCHKCMVAAQLPQRQRGR